MHLDMPISPTHGEPNHGRRTPGPQALAAPAPLPAFGKPNVRNPPPIGRVPPHGLATPPQVPSPWERRHPCRPSESPMSAILPLQAVCPHTA